MPGRDGQTDGMSGTADAGSVRFPSVEELRRRRTAKWTLYPPDVLPAPVAEMDVLPPAPIRRVLTEAIERGATGYPPMDGGYMDAFRAFAARRWGWNVGCEAVFPAVDVGSAATAALSTLAGAGPVVVSTPVYDGFVHWPGIAGRRTVDVPLLQLDEPGADGLFSGPQYRLDVKGIERAFEAGASALLLCNPHNPVGRVHTREELASIATAARRRGALVVSDEVHAPLVFPSADGTSPFVPFLDCCPEAREVGVALHSPSKAWNVAGLKCAFVVAPHPLHRERLAGQAEAGAWAVGTLGAFAAEAAYRESEAWLDELVRLVADNHVSMARGLAEQLPAARVSAPAFGYLSWVDLAGLGWPGEAAEVALTHGRLALGVGSAFGASWARHVRVNLGMEPALVPEVVARLVRADHSWRTRQSSSSGQPGKPGSR